ncbi:hypothetical protein Poli38472_000222 [Pythium oligandrum]|uniref:Uncharacterized protein n=1 Tax=Pythium oligandrum TaxID=41045 RepID=A0A8K1FE61_PYTOL|nr:hypothetical protein Poli38472_000222 [Pythium oligandrum]|eukprot:TMW60180.1 hypothetical protein Poli38472_000222 [Pythium oligandrum]
MASDSPLLPRSTKRYGAIDSPLSSSSSSLSSSSPSSWLDRLFFTDGGRVVRASSRRMEISDLLPLETENRTATSFASVDAVLQHVDGGSLGLLKALWGAHGATLRWCMLGRIVSTLFGILAPVVVQQVVLAFSTTAEHVDKSVLGFWLALFFVTRFLAVLVDTHISHDLNHVGMRLMAAIRSLIFRKAMRRELSAVSKTDISNLATSDASTALAAVQQLTKVWILPLQIAVVTYLLYLVLDIAAFAGIAVVLVSLYNNYHIAHWMSRAYAQLMRLKDERMRSVNQAFGAIQIVKFNAWETRFQEKLASQRAQEIVQLARYCYAGAASSFVLWTSPLLVSTVSFVIYALVLEQELTAAKVFTAMALFNMLRDPLQELPTIIQSLLQSRVSFQRLSAFLGLQEYDPANVTRQLMSPTSSKDVIQVQNASFAWSEDANTRSTLESLSFDIRRGEFVVVTGDVGAGKSSLCAALLGEMHKLSGSLAIQQDASIAFCSQTPWIQHLTIRDNILFGRAFDAQRYDAVLHACCLEEDLPLFPAGDRTEIGERGVNLSGGQKARVALARACYADTDLYVLDAPLAAVDAIVQKQLIDRCLLNLLAAKTVVLVTHQQELLKSLNVVDQHIHLVNGRVVDQSRFTDVNPRVRTPFETEKPKEISHKETANGVLVEEEARQAGDVSFSVWWRYFASVGGVPIVSLLVVTQLLWQAFQIGSDVWLSHATGSSSASPPSSSTILTVYTTLAGWSAVMVLARGLIVTAMGVRASSRLFNHMVDALLHAPMRFFDQNPIGRVLNRFTGDVTILDRSIPNSIGVFLSTAFSTACTLLTAALAIQWLGFLLVPMVVLYLILAQRFVRAFCELSRIRKLFMSPILSHITQANQGVMTLRAFGRDDLKRAIETCESNVDGNNLLWHTEIVMAMWFTQRLQFIGCGVLAVILSAVFCFHNWFSAGTVGLVFTYALSVNSALVKLVQVWSTSENAMVAIERILEYTELESEGTGMLTNEVVSEEWPKHGQIVFENVGFGYSRDQTKPNDLVLRDVSFTIRSGEKLSVVGRTGAGKSSLTMAFFRINELTHGRILIDGIDIARVPLSTLRQRIAIIPQSPKSPSLSKLQILCADNNVLDLELRANGENLSVGERQMLCMARALLRQTKIVILDEATASIDHTTEKLLGEMLRRELDSVTLLTIAHRLATVMHADRILVLDQGKVVECDSPAVLSTTGNGHFAALLREAQGETQA